MGKKKSKIGKAKQAKAKQASGNRGKRSISSSLGGISMSKGLSSKFQQHQHQQSSGAGGGKNQLNALESNTKSKTASIQPSPFTKKFNKSKVKKVFLSSSPPPESDNYIKQSSSKTLSNATYDEQADFARQMASLQERHQAANLKKAMQKQKKSTLLQQGGTVSSLIQSFQPASFQVEKTTNDLLHETVDQMQSMLGVGQPTPAADSMPTPVRNNQSWAVAIQRNDDIPLSSNPFAVLEDEGNDSDNEPASKQKDWTSAFQIAPASFTLLPRTTPTPATTPLRESALSSTDDEVDPDL